MSALKNVRTLTLVAMFVALGIVLRFFSLETEIIRVGLRPVAVMLSGLTLGPVLGGIVALAEDLLGSTLKGYPPFPPITLINLLYGILPPLLLPFLTRLYQRLPFKNMLPLYFLAIGLTQLIAGTLLMPAAQNLLLDGGFDFTLYMARFTPRIPQQILHILIYPPVTYTMVKAIARFLKTPDPAKLADYPLINR